MAFKNEITIYHSLEYKSFDRLKYPKLINTDGKSYMVLEYIEGTRGWDQRVIKPSDLIKALLEFQFSGVKIKTNFINKTLMKWYCKVPCKIFRWSFRIIKAPKDIVTAFQCIWITFKNALMIKKYNKSILIHNDLFNFNNLISGYDDNIYFYDFEYGIYENKWLLLDILDLSFDLLTLNLIPDLLIQYMKQISAHKSIYKYIMDSIIGQTRVILIRKVLGAMLSKTTRMSSKRACEIFLKDTLLSEKEYLRWYIKNVKPYISYVL